MTCTHHTRPTYPVHLFYWIFAFLFPTHSSCAFVSFHTHSLSPPSSPSLFLRPAGHSSRNRKYPSSFPDSPLCQFPQRSPSIPVFDFPLVCKDKKQTPAMGTFSEYPFQPPHLLSVLLSLFFLPRSSLSSGKVKRWVVYSVIFTTVDLNKDALQIPVYV